MNFWVSGHQFGFIGGGIGRASNRESIKKKLVAGRIKENPLNWFLCKVYNVPAIDS